jgi:MFS family permease
MMSFMARTSIYLLGVFIMRCGWFATMPFMTIYIHTNATTNPVLIGSIIGGGWLAACVSGFVGGIYIDRYNPRKIMLLMLTISGMSFFLYYLISPKLLFLILILNMCIGSASACFEIASKTYIATSFSDQQRVHAYNLRYTALNIGAIAGPYIGVWFTLHYPQLLFIFTASAYALVFLLFKRFLLYRKLVNASQVLGLQQIINKIIHDPVLLLLTCLSFLNYWAISQIDTMLPQVLSTRVPHYALVFATIISINAVTVVILQVPFGFVVHKFNTLKLAYLSSLLYASSFVVFAFAYTESALIMAILIFTLGEVIYATVLNLVVDRISTDNMRGVYFGVVSMGMSGLVIGPISGGGILKMAGGTVLYLFTALLLLGGLICYTKLKPSLLRRTNSTVL